MAGKVRTAMATIDKNISNIHVALTAGDFDKAKQQWRLAKTSYSVFETLVSKMSGRSKTTGKLAKIAAFRTKYNNFKSSFGSNLDSL